MKNGQMAQDYDPDKFQWMKANLINTIVDAASYADKNFIYYSLDNHQMIDREPDKDAWDITFTKYLTLYPFQGGFTPYSVTGAFHNEGIEVAQADNVTSPSTYNNFGAHSFSNMINTIGFDWKEFQGTYVIVPNRCYFILDKSDNIWRLTFTNFDGTSTGNIEFNTELIQTTNVEDIALINTFATYPNPICENQTLTVLYDLNANNKGVIKLHDILGREVYTANTYNSGLTSHIIETDNLEKGVYIISLNVNGVKKTDRIMIN